MKVAILGVWHVHAPDYARHAAALAAAQGEKPAEPVQEEPQEQPAEPVQVESFLDDRQ